MIKNLHHLLNARIWYLELIDSGWSNVYTVMVWVAAVSLMELHQNRSSWSPGPVECRQMCNESMRHWHRCPRFYLKSTCESHSANSWTLFPSCIFKAIRDSMVVGMFHHLLPRHHLGFRSTSLPGCSEYIMLSWHLVKRQNNSTSAIKLFYISSDTNRKTRKNMKAPCHRLQKKSTLAFGINCYFVHLTKERGLVSCLFAPVTAHQIVPQFCGWTALRHCMSQKRPALAEFADPVVLI